MAQSKRRPLYDIEEIAPDRFVLHNTRMGGLLKGEGHVQGHFFTLTTWRREGLIARLRARGLAVSTLADQLDALPITPQPPSLGEEGWRPLSNATERYSFFDLHDLRWRGAPVEIHEGTAGVVLRAGSVLRRRQGRGGPASYYLAITERSGGVALHALDETKALLTGFAQASIHASQLTVERRGEAYALPNVDLPPPYRSFLRRIAKETGEELSVDKSSLPLTRELFGRLGIRLVSA